MSLLAAFPQPSPWITLTLGLATVLGLIAFLRVHAFVALIAAALLVSLLIPGPLDQKVTRVANAFGDAAAEVGILIAMASVIGACMMRSGAADRIVQAFLSVLGEKRGSLALTGSGYVLSVPVFFDTVFYLLVPLARSLFRRTNRRYLLYLVAIAAGGTATHAIVPPTPGPLAAAAALNADLGTLLLISAAVALPAALAGTALGIWLDNRLDIPYRETNEAEAEMPPATTPSLGLSLLPVIMPIILITTQTIFGAAVGKDNVPAVVKLVCDKNLALILAAAAAMAVYFYQRRPSRDDIRQLLETSLMSAGVIILITAAGGAFGKMLQQSGLSELLKSSLAGTEASGTVFLFIGFGVASLMKIAQGSSTVAVTTTASILAGMVVGVELSYNVAYLAAAIGAGSLVISWTNDSGFWIFSRMGGLTEAETLKTWTPTLATVGITAFLMTLLLVTVLPLK